MSEKSKLQENPGLVPGKNKVKMSTWSKLVYGTLVAGALAVTGGSYLTHKTIKDNAVETQTAGLTQTIAEKDRSLTTFQEKTQSLESNLDSLDVEAKELAEARIRAEEGRRRAVAALNIERKEKQEIRTTVEDSLRKAYGDSMFNSYTIQLSRYPTEFSQFAYDTEVIDSGSIRLLIKPVKDLELKERIEKLIPTNLDERKEFSNIVEGFFDKYDNLAEKHNLRKLEDYAEVEANKQNNGVWHLVFVDREDNEKLVKYSPGVE